MIIAIVIVHNKNAAGNRNQITALASHLTEVRETRLDENGAVILDEETGQPVQFLVGYRIQGIVRDHLCHLYQIVPFGINPPSNLYLLDSYKVFYGAGDENKTGTHPRFFNWGLKRGIDHGADVVIYLSDLASLTISDLDDKAGRLADLLGTLIFTESTWGKMGHRRLLLRIGQLLEDRTFDQAVTELKARIAAQGYTSG